MACLCIFSALLYNFFLFLAIKIYAAILSIRQLKICWYSQQDVSLLCDTDGKFRLDSTIGLRRYCVCTFNQFLQCTCSILQLIQIRFFRLSYYAVPRSGLFDRFAARYLGPIWDAAPKQPRTYAYLQAKWHLLKSKATLVVKCCNTYLVRYKITCNNKGC